MKQFALVTDLLNKDLKLLFSSLLKYNIRHNLAGNDLPFSRKEVLSKYYNIKSLLL